jgi:SAM-dependent methyltransferase
MSRQPKPTRDRHALYQRAVQTPDVDAAFLDRIYKRLVGRPAVVFKEDFCGTAALSCAWVALGPERRAIGVDLDRPTLAWGETHNLSQLSDAQRSRLTLVQDDVLHVRKPKADLICAFNFSYSVFKERAQMQAYADNASRSLKPGGVFILDAWGGYEVQQPHLERRRLKGGVDYLWDQVSFDPITHDIECRIHFEFRDGRPAVRNAFTYDWRLWTLPELREVMAEAGFQDVHVLWEGTTPTRFGNGVFRRRERGDADAAWVCYVVGRAPG